MGFVLLSPFYVWESGLPQPAHFLGAGLVVALLLLRRRFTWDRKVMPWGFLFSIYAAVVNMAVYVTYLDAHSLLSAIYYGFNFSLFWAVQQLADAQGRSWLVKQVRLAFVVLLFVQALFFLSGKGRAFGENRFMGSFNDPNQLAHWTLWAVIVILAVDYFLQRRLSWWSWVGLLLGFAILVASASRSGLLGFSAIVLALVVRVAFRRVRFHRKSGQVWLFSLLSLGVLAGLLAPVILLGVSNEKVTGFQEKLVEQVQFYVLRVQEGIAKSGENLEERGYDRLWKFPEYLILGAGEGASQRWAGETTFLGEIHSTLAGVIFYYGIPGSLLIVLFIGRIWSTLPGLWLRLLLLAPLLYSLGTYNLRNSMFWLGLAILWAVGKVLREESRGYLKSGHSRIQP
ncbi:hypothetical protein [Thermus sp.]|uniref:hypothetical protein n=1 Tax=Thermus sp. TaxID=275 RepID=UPI003919B326